MFYLHNSATYSTVAFQHPELHLPAHNPSVLNNRLPASRPSIPGAQCQCVQQPTSSIQTFNFRHTVSMCSTTAFQLPQYAMVSSQCSNLQYQFQLFQNRRFKHQHLLDFFFSSQQISSLDSKFLPRTNPPSSVHVTVRKG